MNILKTITKVLLTIFPFMEMIIITFIVAMLENVVVLVIFCINYRKLRGNGTGLFHQVFFYKSGLYQSISLTRKMWEW